MSLLSKFFFDPIKAKFARAMASSNPGVAAAASAGLDAYNAASADLVAAGAAPLSANSAVGLGNKLVADLENGLNAAVTGYATATIAAFGPIGQAIAPEAGQVLQAALSMGEERVHDYVAALFAHHAATVTVTPLKS